MLTPRTPARRTSRCVEACHWSSAIISAQINDVRRSDQDTISGYYFTPDSHYIDLIWLQRDDSVLLKF